MTLNSDGTPRAPAHQHNNYDSGALEGCARLHAFYRRTRADRVHPPRRRPRLRLLQGPAPRMHRWICVELEMTKHRRLFSSMQDMTESPSEPQLPDKLPFELRPSDYTLVVGGPACASAAHAIEYRPIPFTSAHRCQTSRTRSCTRPGRFVLCAIRELFHPYLSPLKPVIRRWMAAGEPSSAPAPTSSLRTCPTSTRSSSSPRSMLRCVSWSCHRTVMLAQDSVGILAKIDPNHAALYYLYANSLATHEGKPVKVIARCSA